MVTGLALGRTHAHSCSSVQVQGRCSADTVGCQLETLWPPSSIHAPMPTVSPLSFRTPSAFRKAWRATMQSKTPMPGRSFTRSSTTTTWPSRASRAPYRRGCQCCRKRSCQSRRPKPLRKQPSEMGKVLTVYHLKVTKGL